MTMSYGLTVLKENLDQGPGGGGSTVVSTDIINKLTEYNETYSNNFYIITDNIDVVKELYNADFKGGVEYIMLEKDDKDYYEVKTDDWFDSVSYVSLFAPNDDHDEFSVEDNKDPSLFKLY